MTTLLAPTTGQSSFSFYSAANADAIAAAAAAADAACVRGVNGPTVVQAMRAKGWKGTAIFDGAGYEPKVRPLDTTAWFEMQVNAGADHILTQGAWVPWDPTGSALRFAAESQVDAAVDESGAVVLLAVDLGLTRFAGQFDYAA